MEQKEVSVTYFGNTRKVNRVLEGRIYLGQYINKYYNLCE